MSFWEGLIADDWWWPCEQKHGRARSLSNRKLILASSRATPVYAWVRVVQGLVWDCLFLFELGFQSLAFRMGCNVSVFEWGFPGVFNHSLPAVVQSLKVVRDNFCDNADLLSFNATGCSQTSCWQRAFWLHKAVKHIHYTHAMGLGLAALSLTVLYS